MPSHDITERVNIRLRSKTSICQFRSRVRMLVHHQSYDFRPLDLSSGWRGPGNSHSLSLLRRSAPELTDGLSWQGVSHDMEEQSQLMKDETRFMSRMERKKEVFGWICQCREIKRWPVINLDRHALTKALAAAASLALFHGYEDLSATCRKWVTLTSNWRVTCSTGWWGTARWVLRC